MRAQPLVALLVLVVTAAAPRVRAEAPNEPAAVAPAELPSAELPSDPSNDIPLVALAPATVAPCKAAPVDEGAAREAARAAVEGAGLRGAFAGSLAAIGCGVLLGGAIGTFVALMPQTPGAQKD